MNRYPDPPNIVIDIPKHEDFPYPFKTRKDIFPEGELEKRLQSIRLFITRRCAVATSDDIEMTISLGNRNTAREIVPKAVEAILEETI